VGGSSYNRKPLAILWRQAKGHARFHQRQGNVTMKTLALAAALALLGGCATCQQHPVYCAVGSAIIVGSVAATIAANSHHDEAAAATRIIRPTY
jgi:uncharacterized lipoprotein YajG